MDGNNGAQTIRSVRKQELIAKILREINLRKKKTGPAEQDIAVIGLSGRYPQARDPDAFWDNLRNGRNCISEIPADRWPWEKYFDAAGTREGTHYTRFGGFIADADKFDPLFFNISPREAERMDPQERIFLETIWTLMEDAGYAVSDLKAYPASVGVFVGVMNNGYGLLKAEAWRNGHWSGGPATSWSVANRVSYTFDFHGPSLALDTACSSSLTAIHLACESLKRGECGMAIAGGVNLILHPLQLVSLSSIQMLSRSDQCRSFGRGADGFVAGEGVGAVLLKPLGRAVADQDHIYGVIKASRINSGGKTGGYTVPNPNAQAALILQALKKSGIDPRSIGYLEAHGTGTALGDPVEVAGLMQAFGQYTRDKQFCAIGSVKSNIGHLEAAAGIAGLTKILLQFKHRQLAPSIHCAAPNPKIEFDQSAFYLQRDLQEWPEPDPDAAGNARPRRAGLSSFGAGGANAHLILEEYRPSGAEVPAQAPAPQLIVLSAASAEQLKEYAAGLCAWLENRPPQTGLENIAHTLQTGREALPQRLAIIAKNPEELGSGLKQFAGGAERTGGATVLSGTAGENEALKVLLADGRASRTFMRAILEDRDLAKLAGLWVSGVGIDWKALHGDRALPKIPLPTYPFKRKRYWIRAAAEAGLPAREALPVKKENDKPGNLIALKQYAHREIIPAEPPAAASRIALKETGGIPQAETVLSPPPLPLRENGTKQTGRPGVDAQSIRARLREEIAKTLYLSGEDLDERKTLAELGMDSILAVELIKRLNARFPVNLKASKLYDLPDMARLADYITSVLNASAENETAPAGESRKQEPASPPDRPGPGSGVPAAVREEVIRTLYVESGDLNDDKPLAEYGMDSILAVELMKRLNTRFGLALKARKLYDHGTLRTLTHYIQSQEVRPDQAGPAVEDRAGQKAENGDPAAATVVQADRPAIGARSVPSEKAPAGATARDIRDTDIAVIGISGRFPDAEHVEAFWENLKNGVDSVTEVSKERWDAERFFDKEGKDPDRTYCKWGGFLEHIDLFDNRFFGISPAEAEKLMPEQRIVLEEAWHAFEDAGYSPKMLDRLNCGIFLGVMGNIEYPAPHVYNAHSIMAARLAYLLNLKGPALALDCACSSSLVAVHLACRSLIAEETGLMLAGGVSLYLTEKSFIGLSKAGMLSATGRCRAFADEADGFVPAEGAGFLVLKKLSKAVRDRDFIYGVIRGSALNQDGRTNGLTAPSSESQKNLELAVYRRFNIDPRTITLVEAHGTGTRLGDPIEIDALTDAFRAYTSQKQFCAVGSVKSNIGHASAAAGAAGLIKVLLALQHKKIPPTLHCASENRQIAFAETPFYVNRGLTDWISENGALRRAAVSSFGYSGTNAHLVVEEYRAPRPDGRRADIGAERERSGANRVRLFLLSAQSEASLRQYARKLLSFLEHSDPESAAVDDWAHTLYFGRAQLEERLAVLADSPAGLQLRLRAFLEDRPIAGIYRGSLDRKTRRDPVRQPLPLQTDAPPDATRVEAAARQWIAGEPDAGHDLFANLPYQKVPLPTYPFERRRFWFQAVSDPRPAASGLDPEKPAQNRTEPGPTPPTESGAGEFEQFLIRLVAGETKYPPAEIEPAVDLEHYGIDSVMIVNLNRKLETVFGKELSGTLFFEYRSIGRLAEFLRKKYGQLPQPAAGREPPVRLDPDFRLFVEEETTPGKMPRQADRGTAAWPDLAVIGMSGIFPQADTLEQFWENLKTGRDCITEIPLERWDYRGYFDPAKGKPGKIYGKWGGFINGVDLFDPYFFNIAPKDAASMDPQERLFLETAWHTLEDAGYTRASLKPRSVGVFVGVTYNEYQYFGKKSGDVTLPPPAVHASIANRVSYLFDFSGPSLAVDTMCSSSLVAVYLACQSIRNGDCDLALAGGVNVSIHPNKYLHLSAGRFLSGDGRCRSFGAGGDGYVPGEGVGAVLIKPLDQALRDRDSIYGILKGGALNHGGKTNGYTVPNPRAQGAAIQEALRRAGWDPGSISYIETHGTGTALGDPIEMTGLLQAFENTAGTRPACAIGSLKSNIGHLESAAGIAGLIKILLQMKHGALVPSLHAEPLNENINWAGTPFYVQKTLAGWQDRPVHLADGTVRQVQRAGLSAFGAGGTNAHLLLESHPQIPRNARDHEEQKGNVVILSAKNPQSLQSMAQHLLKELENGLKGKPDGAPLLDEIAYTLQTGREPMNERLALVVRDPVELFTVLKTYCSASGIPEQIYIGSLCAAKPKTPFFPEVVRIADRLLRNRNYKALAQLWIKGEKIDWEKLYSAPRPKKISLPGYVFQKERYWFGATANAETSGAAPAGASLKARPSAAEQASAPAPLHGAMLFVPVLKEKRLSRGDAAATPASIFLVLGRDDFFFRKLKEHLARPGRVFVLAEKGPAFRKQNKEQYIVDPQKASDYVQLLEALTAAGLLPDRVIHLWAVPESALRTADRAGGLTSGFYSVFYLLQAFLRLKSGQIPRLCFLYSNAGREYPEFAAVGGLLRSAAREQAQLKARLLEIGEAPRENDGTDRIGMICDLINEPFEAVTELTIAESGMREICFEEFVPTHTGALAPLFKPGRVCLITGGAGGLGRLFAGYLAEKYGIRLILTGRADPQTAGIDRRFGETRIGERITYMQADISDREQTAQLIRRIREEFGPIQGVIHCAGTMRAANLQRKTDAEILAVFGPKVFGTLYLDEALADEPLEFFILFSSITTVIGNPGNSDYAFANAFMDHYAAYRAQLVARGTRRGKTLAVNWPMWRDGGLRIDRAVEALYVGSTGLDLLTRESGLRLFEQALAAPAGRVIPVLGDRTKILKILGTPDVSGSGGTGATETGGPTDSANLKQRLTAELLRLVCDITKTSANRARADQEFAAYGLDSVGFTELAARLNAAFSLEITPPLFYEYRTADFFSDYLCSRFGSVLEEQFRKSAENPGPAKISESSSASRLFETATGLRNEPPAKTGADFSGQIAVIGLACRMPGSRNAEEFWEHLVQGDDLVAEIPADRWKWEEYYGDPLKTENKTNVKWGGFLDAVDWFDASFFGLSKEEARIMDPRQKLLLETVYETIAEAGYRLSDLKGRKIGVFIGASNADYADLLKARGTPISAGTAVGTADALLANRISYFCDFRGPSETIDTACSSALVAVQRAVESIQNGSCEMALAGGVNLLFTPHGYIALNKAGMLSLTGRCRPFDKDADGYVRGEGVGAVLLKKLKNARRDRDSICATILGTAINHGGRAHSLTAPNPEAQADLIREAFQKARIDPRTVTYIETHGTGTKIGDPIEINGLVKAWKQLSRAENPPGVFRCALGSVKSNIGHLEAAAGMAGLLKVLLAMRFRAIPGTLHFREWNPFISLEGCPFYIPGRTIPWEQPRDGQGRLWPRRAGVSSFGFGGTNAHVLLEEHLPSPKHGVLPKDGVPLVFTLSARSPDSLRKYAEAFVAFFENRKRNASFAARDFRDWIYTLQTGREEFPVRLAFPAANPGEVLETLRQFLGGRRSGKIRYHELNPDAARERMNASADLPEEVREWKKNGALEKLAEHWTRGAEIPWAELFAGEYRETVKVSLPTCPFQRELCGMLAFREENGPPRPLAFPKSAAAGEAEWSPDRIREAALQILAEKTTGDVRRISVERNFSELGITSINQIMIVNDLIARIDFLSSAVDGDSLLKCQTIRELTAYIGGKSKNGKACAIPGPRPSLEEIQRAQYADRTVRFLQPVGREPFALAGSLIVDESHPFFFDHPLDHVSGIHLLKAMDEVVKTGHIFRNGLDPQSLLFVSKIRASFSNVCPKNGGPELVVREVPNGSNGPAVYRAEARNAETRYAQAEFELLPAAPRTRSSTGALSYPAQCDKSIVGKWNGKNVYIGDVGDDDPPQCRLLTNHSGSFFAECRKGRIDMLVLLEASRQAFKVFARLLSRDAQCAIVLPPKPLSLLKEIELSVSEPLSVTDEIYFVFNDQSIQSVGSNVVCGIQGAVTADGAAIGHFNIVSLLLNGEIFKGAQGEKAS